MTTMTGPVRYGEDWRCGCGEEMEIERLDPAEMIQVWACPEGHRWVRGWGEDHEEPEWREAE